MGWVRTEIDAFFVARLRKEGLHPAPEADRRTLIRRLSFDLIGLPPTPEEVQDFVADDSPNAYTTLVDRLLASPHYGERWGQHWLDVVRFAESEGFEYDRHLPGLWRYRDYVIDSFNADKPYDRFVVEQLAGDELDPHDPELQTAVGFHRLGPVRRNAGNQAVTGSRNEVLTELTNIVGSAFLGLTVGCARCHDHMFDPILQKDYYRLQAYFSATHEHDVLLAPPDVATAWRQKTEAINKEIDQLKAEANDAEGERRQQLLARVKEAEARLPAPLPTICSVRNDAARREPVRFLVRGDWQQAKEPVGPRPLGILVSSDVPELPADAENPRTQLARWIVDPEHPLTARAMVNRIWHYHFGQGLVDTPNDLGANGGIPSHPELLDWLANRFVESGWRLKPLHRLIVTSSVYRQSSRAADNPEAARRDPENKLLARFNRRRLEAETLRDAMLAVSGRLNRKSGGPSIMVPVEQDLIDLLYKPSQWEVTADAGEHDRRSIYLISKRNLRLPFMETFDQPNAQTSCARREASTHAPQALELLNGSLANHLAASFAQRLEQGTRTVGAEEGSSSNANSQNSDGAQKQIELAFVLATGRPPSDVERRLSLDFLKRGSPREFALAMFNLNAFLYVN